MFSLEPTGIIKTKFKETSPFFLFNTTLVKCHDSKSVQCDTCYFPEYEFVSVNESTCVINDQSDTYSTPDVSKINAEFSYGTMYSMFVFTQNGTNYCDPTVSKVVTRWNRIVICTCVFGGLTFALVMLAVCICLCGTRLERCCCKLDAGSEHRKLLVKSDNDNEQCGHDCGC